jgi:hypothetical protein
VTKLLENDYSATVPESKRTEGPNLNGNKLCSRVVAEHSGMNITNRNLQEYTEAKNLLNLKDYKKYQARGQLTIVASIKFEMHFSG